MKKKFMAIGLLSAILFTACKKDLEDTPAANEASTMAISGRSGNAGGEVVPNEILIKFKKGTTATGRQNALARISGNVQEFILTKAMQRFNDDGVYLVHTPLNALEALSKARGVEVEYAEPNFVYNHTAVSNDPYYTNGSLWGMYGPSTSPANEYGSQAGAAWGLGHTGSASVHIGVIDEGIQVLHSDLKNNIWVNPFDPKDGVDNDGNGYVDDINGWDFANNDNTVYDGGTRGRLDKHGTHVAGTIGAEMNGSGVVGVNWNIKMISAKFLGSNGGTTANAIKAVDYLTDLKTRHGIDIPATNNSWGGGGFSQALLDAITRGANANILFIAAAGNGGSDGVGDDNDTQANYPSNYQTTGAAFDAVIAVAALKSDGTKASYSNFGLTTVDLGAPGSGIFSTLPNNTYGSYSGTSMATPHVTGGAALRAAYSTERGEILKSTILSAATNTPTSSMNGKTVTGGRLNVSGF